MKPAVLALLLAASGFAWASDAEWRCRLLGGSWDAAIQLTVDYESETGTVTMAGMPATHTHFKVLGLLRYWFWEDEIFVHVFALGPGGRAEYGMGAIGKVMEGEVPDTMGVFTCEPAAQ